MEAGVLQGVMTLSLSDSDKLTIDGMVWQLALASDASVLLALYEALPSTVKQEVNRSLEAKWLASFDDVSYEGPSASVRERFYVMLETLARLAGMKIEDFIEEYICKKLRYCERRKLPGANLVYDIVSICAPLLSPPILGVGVVIALLNLRYLLDRACKCSKEGAATRDLPIGSRPVGDDGF
jgi:hypothetical protein